jgi:hypothetical protein
VKKGLDVLRDKSLNRSITFTAAERKRLGLRGLLPHCVTSQRQLVERVMTTLEHLPRDLDRYMQLSALQERNERLFYRTVVDHIDTILPLIYTPTVGEACREFSHIARDLHRGGERSHGLVWEFLGEDRDRPAWAAVFQVVKHSPVWVLPLVWPTWWTSSRGAMRAASW